MTSLELVKKQAGPGFSVVEYRYVPVDGMEFFVVTPKQRGRDADHQQGVAMLAGATTWLAGVEAMKAVSAHGVSDPKALCDLSLLLLVGSSARVFAKPEEAPGPMTSLQKAEIKVPAMVDGTLEAWYHGGRLGIQRLRVNLTSWQVESTPIQSVIDANRSAGSSR